jgi:hypothetical protein
VGFQLRTYRLVFEEPAFEGLEIRTRGATIDDAVAWNGLFSGEVDLLKPGEANEANRQRLYEVLVDRIIGWNLEGEDGQQVPCTVETLRGLEASMVLAIGRAWMTASAGVSRPLEQPSPNGQPSPEASIPMEVLSPNPPS